LALSRKRNTTLAVEIEATEGVYQAPAAATSYVQTLDKGFDILGSKQLLARSVFTASIGETAPLTGEFNVTATVPTECRANSVEGAAPEYDKLMKAAFGASRANTTAITTKATGNTASVLQIADADISKLNVGDSILIKESGAYAVTAITAVDSTPGAANVTLLVPRATSVYPASVVIGKFTTYTVADTGHPTLSLSKYIEGTVLEQAVGCRVKDVTLETFATGKLPSWKFALEGLNFASSVTSTPYTPSYDTSLPPIVLDARIYQNGVAFVTNEMQFQMANSLGFATSIAAPNGRTSGLATQRKITGTLLPYKQNNSVTQYANLVANSVFSLFAYAKVPTGVAGQFSQIVAIYMPACIITTIKEVDQNGLLQDSISFQASRGVAGTTPEIYLTFI
jgi:hypothetical protein